MYFWGLVVSIVALSWLILFFTPKRPLHFVLIDKTVLTQEVPEHRSLNWVLTHERYTDTNRNSLSPETDYYGFFPKENRKFTISDFERQDSHDLDALGQMLDVLYYTDAYGIYTNEWYDKGSINERSGMVYGAMTMKEVELIEAAIKYQKLTLLEFNILASPTESGPRSRLEKALDTYYTGWTGRIFQNLDSTNNPDLPRWVVHQYNQWHQNRGYRFTGKGMVMVHESGRVEVFPEATHLKDVMLTIKSSTELQEEVDVPAQAPYGFWFDVMRAGATTKTMATYTINVNALGKKLLDSIQVPTVIPAVLKPRNYPLVWYFCGDWADNNVPYPTTWFAGSQWLRFLYYPWPEETHRGHFFWKYYRPLIRGIMDNYWQQQSVKKPRQKNGA